MCLAQGPQRSYAGEARTAALRSRVKHSTTEPLRSLSDAGEARTHGPLVSSQALYHWATVLPFFFFFLSLNTGTIKFWSLRQGVQFWNFEEKTKTKQKNKNKTKKTKNLSAVFLTKWGVP